MAWAPDYCTSAELKAFARIDDTVDDAQVALAITAASRSVDLHCGRQFGSVSTEERFYTAQWDRRRCRWIVEIDDLMDDTGDDPDVVDADGTVVGAIDDYVLEPRNAAARGRPWTHLLVRPDSTYKPTDLVDGVSATRPWGWTSVPDPVKQATLLQASRFLARRDSPYGVAGSPTVGSELRLLARVDVDVAVILSPFKRWWGAR